MCQCLSALLHRRSPKQKKEDLAPKSRADVIRIAADKRKALRDATLSHFSARGKKGVSLLTDQEEKWLTDEVLAIYVQARSTLSEQVAILTAALHWRIENRVALLSCETCPYCVANPKHHDARLFGFDREGDYVFATCFELPQDNSGESAYRHLLCLFERALRDFPAASGGQSLDCHGHPRIRQWTFIFDLYGFGLKHGDPRVPIKLLELLQMAYRGRVKSLIVLNAPTLFWGLWAMISPFIKQVTTAKIQFANWNGIRPQLEAKLGSALAEELAAEAEENRDPERVSRKVWEPFYGPALHRSRRALGGGIGGRFGINLGFRMRSSGR